MALALFTSEPFTYPGGIVAAGVLVKVVHGGTLVPAPIYHDSLGVRAPNPIRTDDDGIVAFYAEPGDYDLLANGTTTPVTIPPGADFSASYAYVMSVGGSGGPGVGVGRMYNDIGRDQMVAAVRVTAQDPGGGGVVVDVNIDGASIYASPADRPALPVASGTRTIYAPLDTGVELSNGSYLTVDVDAGTFNHLVVQIFVR